MIINLITPEEAFLDILKKDPNFKGIIDIEISDNKDYIFVAYQIMDQEL